MNKQTQCINTTRVTCENRKNIHKNKRENCKNNKNLTSPLELKTRCE